MAKVNKVCKICGRAAKAYAARIGKEGYCTKHANMELAKEQEQQNG